MLAKETGIKTIFFETLTSPKLAKTIAEEVQAVTKVLNPLEGLTEEEQTAGENYLSVMRTNLTELASALHCND